MSECLGLIGKLFGHKYERQYPISHFVCFFCRKLIADENIKEKIICKRCGKQIEEK